MPVTFDSAVTQHTAAMPRVQSVTLQVATDRAKIRRGASQP